MEGHTDTDGYTDKEQGDLISLFYFFQNKKSKPETILETRLTFKCFCVMEACSTGRGGIIKYVILNNLKGL
jgi:hypothetical protein